MKRITVSLPDGLVDQVKQAVGDGSVSAYVAEALRDYVPGESLEDILAAWDAETPVPPEVQARITRELDEAGFARETPGADRRAG